MSTRPPVRDLLTVRLPVEPEIRMLPPVLEAKAADCPVCDIEREAPVPALHDSAEASNTAPLSEAPGRAFGSHLPGYDMQIFDRSAGRHFDPHAGCSQRQAADHAARGGADLRIAARKTAVGR